MKTFFAIIYCVVWPFFNLFHPCKAIGRENIPEGAAILCPNHTRMSDPFFVIYALGLKIRPRTMAKAELMRVPLIGWLLKKAGVFAVERGKSDVGAVKEAIKCLKGGDKLLLFPEGTRHRDGTIDESGKTGAAMFAVRTGAPLVPIFIPAEKRWFRPTPVVFGQPFFPQVEGRRASADEYKVIAKELMSRIAALEELAR
ncbi:MAG: 1-acyl-sn-glycerol-3-phosphate acyltransferase [Oscillospiraceae bacterium]|jgi:1-acyl-sn-glycerol-3-phosphate acyltransferase|nr:1-acyl-sn-glycerol-3-phosphate acyltransferase [Oscillospiraceae bacterium]